VDHLGRHEMMDPREPLHADVRKQSSEDSGLYRLFLVREIAIGVGDREGARAEDVAVKTIFGKCAHEGRNPRRSLTHLWRNRAGRRGQLRSRLHLLADERRHELVTFQAAKLRLERGEERALFVAQLAGDAGRFKKRKAEDAVLIGARERQGDETAAGVSNQMEAAKALGICEATERLNFLFDRVIRWRRRLAVDLEILEVELGSVADVFHEGPITQRGRCHAAGDADDLGPVAHSQLLLCGAMPISPERRRTISMTSSTCLESRPRQRITSSLVSKLG